MMRKFKRGEGFRIGGMEVTYGGTEPDGRAILRVVLPPGGGIGEAKLLSIQLAESHTRIGRVGQFLLRFAAGEQAEFF